MSNYHFEVAILLKAHPRSAKNAISVLLQFLVYSFHAEYEQIEVDFCFAVTNLYRRQSYEGLAFCRAAAVCPASLAVRFGSQ